MKGFVLDGFDSEPRLRDDLPEPEPGEGELAVRVRASSANPVDNAVAGGSMRDYAESPAGAAPVAALTALAAIEALDLREGEPILIIGAAGGVGSFAVQLAKRAGAHVIAPGLPEDEGFLVDLGADHVIPRDGDVVAHTRELESGGVAALIDTVDYSRDEVEVYEAALAEGGRVASPIRAAGEGPDRYNVGGSTENGALERLARLLTDGLTVPIQRTYPLERAGEALADLQAKHTQGKLAVAVAS